MQRQEATALAKVRSGLDLDPVEADRWWGRRALRTRVEQPGNTIRLLLLKFVLLLDNYEHSLGYHPQLDSNPWRLTIGLAGRGEIAVVPFALLLGLAAAAVMLAGTRGSGGWRIWGAILACAATPLLFYVSSRYRLPATALLTVPAGSGLAALSLCVLAALREK